MSVAVSDNKADSTNVRLKVKAMRNEVVRTQKADRGGEASTRQGGGVNRLSQGEAATTSGLCRKQADYVGLGEHETRVCLMSITVSNNKAGSIPVRLARIELNGEVETECMLDQGVVMNVMQEDVWECLKVLKVLMWTNLRLVNTGTLVVKGVISRLKVQIGGILIVILVHIVKEAMFDVIFGRLFFALMECTTKDYASNKQTLLLTDSADQSWKSQVET